MRIMTPAGWRLVPVDATEEQEHAVAPVSLTFARAIHSSSIPAAEVYGAMVAAAPDPLQDDRLIERAARTAYEDMRAPHERNWPNEDEHIRSGYIGTARAVLALFRGEQA